MGDASPCHHSLLAIICGHWPSQLSEVSLGKVGCQNTREQFGPYLPQCHFLTTLQELTRNSDITGEHHKELSTSRLRRDEADLVTVATKLDRFTSFSDDKSSQGLLQMSVNVHDL